MYMSYCAQPIFLDLFGNGLKAFQGLWCSHPPLLDLSPELTQYLSAGARTRIFVTEKYYAWPLHQP